MLKNVLIIILKKVISFDQSTIFYDNVNNALILTFPEQEQILINIYNRASTQYKGLDMRCLANYKNRLIHGDANGNILDSYGASADYDINDEESNRKIRAECIQAFLNFDTPSKKKKLRDCRVNFRAPGLADTGLRLALDYDITKSVGILSNQELTIAVLGINFTLGTSYLIEPEGLVSYQVENLNDEARSCAIHLVVEKLGYNISWISSFIRYIESEKEF